MKLIQNETCPEAFAPPPPQPPITNATEVLLSNRSHLGSLVNG